MSQNPQNQISQTAFKHYNEFRRVRNSALIWVQITIDTGMTIIFETIVKERYQWLLEFITIDLTKIEQQHLSNQDIITIPMTTPINNSFNKHPMPWEIINIRLLHPSESFMIEINFHKTLFSLPNKFPTELNKAQFTIYYTGEMTTFPKGETVDTSNILSGDIIHI